MSEKQLDSVMCPKCNKFLTKVDKTQNVVHKIACKHCGKWIWFNTAAEYMEIKDTPKRISASGCRFY